MAEQTTTTPSHTVRVNTASRAYDVVIGHGLLASVGRLTREALGPKPTRTAIVYDDNLPEHTITRAQGSLQAAGFAPALIKVHASEQLKSLATLSTLLDELAAARLDRLDPVIALGGGIVGDVVGFAAAVYRRGVPVVQCPTTLLSMVDAAVGGKTGINLLLPGPDSGLRKNLVGAFHQPHLVVVDPSVLGTLPVRHLRSGLAECIKHAMIGAEANDAGLLDWTEAELDSIFRLEPRTLGELLARNIAIKAAIVATDEREDLENDAGGRALLNLGHTFGHALEAVGTLSPGGRRENAPLQHGEAVALGLVAACVTGREMGTCSASLAPRIARLLDRARLPFCLSGLPEPAMMMELMGHDKKVRAGKLRLILPTEGCRAKVVVDPPTAAVVAGWNALKPGGNDLFRHLDEPAKQVQPRTP
jgi:3-dehydroquinate synthetase